MDFNPNFFFDLVHAYALRFDKLTHVDQTMTQTHHAPMPLLFCLSPMYQLSDIATSSLTSKKNPSFSHNDFIFGYKDLYSTLPLKKKFHI